MIETHQVVTIRARGSRLSLWCAGCAAPSDMITPDEAAALRQVSPGTIARWLDATLMHSGENYDGSRVVCLASLFAVPDEEAEPC